MSYLYALQMLIPDYGFNPVKIGYSSKPEDRTRSFTGGPFPVVCLGYWAAENGRNDETAAHSELRRFRLFGEWFYPAEEVKTFIERRVSSPVSTRPISKIKKVAQFDRRFQEILDESGSVPTTPPPPLPNPFDYPFPTPYESRVDLVMQRIAERWPCLGRWTAEDQLIKRKELIAVTGLDEKVINQKMTRIQMVGLIRYRLCHVREFLMNYPEYIDRIAA